MNTKTRFWYLKLMFFCFLCHTAGLKSTTSRLKTPPPLPLALHRTQQPHSGVIMPSSDSGSSSPGRLPVARHPFRKRAPTVISHHAAAPASRATTRATTTGAPGLGDPSSLLPTLVLVLLGLVAFTLAIQTVRHFLRPEHRRVHVVLASSGAIFLGFCTMVLPPLDVYATASHRTEPARLKAAYLILFATEIVWLSVVLPFSFFFHAANDAPASTQNTANAPSFSPAQRRKRQQESNSLCARVCRALQRTLVFVFVVALAFLAGLTFRPGHEAWSAEAMTQKWMERVFDTAHQGTEALLFITGIVTTAGFAGVVLYTGYGMAALPLDLLRGYKDPEMERLEAETSLLKIRSQLRVLDRKKSSTGSRRERAIRLKLRQKASVARQHVQALNRLTNRSGAASCVPCRVAGPCRKVSGAVLLVLTCLLTTAVLLSANDPGLESAAGCKGRAAAGNDAEETMARAAASAAAGAQVNNNSTIARLVCEAESGYLGTLLNKPRLFNPFDESLVVLSDYFPLDLVTISGALSFMFAASLYGVSRLGLRCCICISVYRFRRRATSASAVLVFGAVCILVALALLVQVPVLAPKYATFGPQTVGDNRRVHCSLSDDVPRRSIGGGSGSKAMVRGKRHCEMSQVAVLLVQMTRGYPIFSHLFFFGSWLFAIVVCISMVLRGCCGRRAPNFTEFDFDSLDGVEDDDDVELAKGLLSGGSQPPLSSFVGSSSSFGSRLVHKYNPAGSYRDYDEDAEW